MSKSLAEATAAEKAAIQAFDELVAAKTKEINALTSALEAKMTRWGNLAVEIVCHTSPPASPAIISNPFLQPCVSTMFLPAQIIVAQSLMSPLIESFDFFIKFYLNDYRIICD